MWTQRLLVVAIFIAVCVTTTAGKTECDPPGSSPHRSVEDDDQKTPGKYLPGDYIAFRCDEGYSPTTLPEVNCNADFEWDPLPECQPTTCRVSPVDHGWVMGPEKRTWLSGEWVSFECAQGYDIHPYSAANLQCVGSELGDLNSGWDRPLPICKAVRCPPIFSSDIENGYITASTNGSTRGQFGVGDNVTATCHDGYFLQGTKTRTCLTEGTWSGTIQICDARDSLCGAPGTPVGGRKYGTAYNWKDQVTFECDPGMSMIGNSVRTCLENGYWSGEQPRCIGKDEFMAPEELSDAYGDILHQLKKPTNADRMATLTSYELQDVLLGNNMYMKVESLRGRSLSSLRNHHGLNLFFMIDTSKSISQKDRSYSVNVVKEIVKQMNIGKHDGDTVVGVIAYNNTVWGRWAPQDLKIREDLDRALEDIRTRSTGGGTAPTLALKTIRDLFVPDAAVARKPNTHKVPQAIIMFTDGNANMGGDPRPLVKEMKPETEFYVVALGEANMEVLKEIATSEEREHLIKPKGHSESDVASSFISNKIDYSACGKAGDHSLNSGVLVTSAKEEAWPWMVGIYKYRDGDFRDVLDVVERGKPTHTCGGSIIARNWILTAAHCLPPTQKYLLKFGSIRENLMDNAGETASIKMLVATRPFIHHKFNLTTLQHDIALIKLPTRLKFSRGIRPVCLPKQDSEDLYANGTDAVVTGWGWWNETQKNSMPNLKQMTMKVYNQTACEKRMPKSKRDGRLNEYSFCAGGMKDHNDELMDACPSDSGGPLVSADLEDKTLWRQTGIVCFGDERNKCRLENGAGGYTKVSKYVDWIEETMRNNSRTEME